MKQQLTALIDLIRARIPRLMPDTPDKQKSFIDEILRIGGFPDNRSFRNSIVTQILHIPADKKYVTLQNFIDAIRRSIVNQLAYNQMQAFKEELKNEETKQSATGQVE